MNTRLFVVLLLGFSSGIPYTLVSGSLQAWFAVSGMPLMLTGLLSFMGFPYIFRLFFSPLLDQYALFNIGKRRSWILCSQILLFFGFNTLAFFNPETHTLWLIIFVFLMSFLSALQDAAIDAHRIEWLPASQYGIGASLAVLGYRLALFLSGGIGLIMASQWGFSIFYHGVACLMIPGILTTLFTKEPKTPTQGTLNSQAINVRLSVMELKSRLNLTYLFLFIFFYKLASAFTAQSSGILMPFLIQGMGFSLTTVAYFNKMFGLMALVLGGIVAGILLLRWSLYRALLIFGLVQAVGNSFFLMLSLSSSSLMLLAGSVIFDNFASGLGSIALVTLFMRLVNQAYTATQFSLFTAISLIPAVVSGPFAILVAQKIGWSGLYQFSCISALFFIPFLLKLKPDLLAPPFDDASHASSNHYNVTRFSRDRTS